MNRKRVMANASVVASQLTDMHGVLSAEKKTISVVLRNISGIRMKEFALSAKNVLRLPVSHDARSVSQ